ncbi:MAG: HAD family phosphatase [Clostridia bacterium]|nr:HAD family phosphatase [Clostridia bacterium]
MTDSHLIFVDFDGTLISDSYYIPSENIEAIQAVRKKGHKVFLNTGRSYANCPPELLSISDCFDGMICGNGSFILYKNKVIRNVHLPFDLFLDLFRYFFNRPEKCCVFQSCDTILKTGLNADRFCPEGVNIYSIDEITQNYKDVKINVFCAEGNLDPDFYAEFGDKIQVYQCSTYADCVTKGFSKAVGIQKVLELLNHPAEKTVAVGDSENDIPMFDCCGISVAMDNAPDSVRQSADIVSSSSADCGVAKALTRLFL